MELEKKSNHKVNIVRLGEPRVHTNADSLELFDIGGYQVVTKKGNFKAGDLAVYIQPDSVVPQTEPFKFIWETYVGLGGLVPERKRRITVRKFRKEWSEGLLMPISDFNSGANFDGNWKQHTDVSNGRGYVYFRNTVGGVTTVPEGEDVSDILGITHYDPDAGKPDSTGGETSNAPRKRYPYSLKGWFYFICHKLGIRWGTKSLAREVSFHLPEYDVEALKNYTNAFEPEELVFAAEKIHGSNARYVYLDGEMYAGSHYQWKHPKSGGVYIKALKDQPWIEEWCRAHEGYALYGEVTPTQKGFDYGSPDVVQFFVFDVLKPDGNWANEDERYALGTDRIIRVPVIYAGQFGESCKALADGQSVVPGAKHIREGIVIRPVVERHVHGLGRLQLKLVSNSFLEKDNK